MVTVVTKIHLDLPMVQSLKEKRRILKSLITRVRNSFNVSVAEVDENDSHRTAVLGMAVVANNSAFADQVTAKVINKIDGFHDVVLADYRTESY
ncbi:MAG: DUF503 domain-containing protein [candidate division Zixibacteria bacterium]|nr:DUF503 domain-containing protein [candidate division Zixibacteria bacterium]